jgi:hypothetical protein
MALRLSIFLITSIPIQLLFWMIYHTVRIGGELNPNEFGTIAIIGGIYLVLAIGLGKKKKWAHRISVVILSLMSLTTFVKLAKGLSQPSFGYLLFLVTYLVSVVLLLTPSVRKVLH